MEMKPSCGHLIGFESRRNVYGSFPVDEGAKCVIEMVFTNDPDLADQTRTKAQQSLAEYELLQAIIPPANDNVSPF